MIPSTTKKRCRPFQHLIEFVKIILLSQFIGIKNNSVIGMNNNIVNGAIEI
jgi:hypothetical protein